MPHSAFVTWKHNAQGKRRIRHNHTIDVGLGALTGRPFALTGARVPAFSAALCSRWIYVLGGKRRFQAWTGRMRKALRTLAFLEIGMTAIGVRVVDEGVSE